MKTTQTRNEGYGLWGTCGEYGIANVQQVWDNCLAYYTAKHGLTPVQARNLLDNRFGRRVADRVACMGGNVEAACIWVDANWARMVDRSIREITA